jgi:hypothetical protein
MKFVETNGKGNEASQEAPSPTLQLRAEPIIQQTLHQNLKLALSYRLRLEKKWDKVVSNRYAFVPSELKNTARWSQVRKENSDLGNFATQYLIKNYFTTSEITALENLKAEKTIVAVGFGRNYDSHWLHEAMEAGLKTVWVDVSSVACEKARTSMQEQYDGIRGDWEARRIVPQVVQAEIQTLLADPEEYKAQFAFDFSKVAVWYFCRTLTCLSARSARTVLQLIGAYSFSKPSAATKLCIISAFKDENPKRVGTTSKLYFKKDILQMLQKGTERPLEIVNDERHTYFSQIYSAITIQQRA